MMRQYEHIPIPGLSLKLEVFTSAALTLWGAWLLVPANHFDVDAFRLLALVAPELVVGVLAFSVGLFSLYALIYSYEKQRLIMMGAVALSWASIAVFVAAVNVFNPSTVAYVSLALGAVWCLPDAIRRYRRSPAGRNKRPSIWMTDGPG